MNTTNYIPIGDSNNKCYIDSKLDTELNKGVIVNVFQTLPPGGSPLDSEAVVNYIMDVITFEKFTSENKAIDFTKFKKIESQNNDKTPFILTQACLKACGMLRNLFLTGDFPVDSGVKSFKGFLFNELTQKASIQQINFLMVLQLELICQLNLLKKKYPESQAQILEAETLLIDGFYNIDEYLKKDDNSLFFEGKSNLNKSFDIISKLLNKIEGDEEFCKPIQRIIKHTRDALNDRENRFPLLLLPTQHSTMYNEGIFHKLIFPTKTERKYNLNYQFYLLRNLMLRVKTTIESATKKIESLNDEIKLLESNKKYSILTPISNNQKNLLSIVKSIKTNFNNIEKTIYINNLPFSLHPFEENYIGSLKSVKTRINILKNLMPEMTKQYADLLKLVIIWKDACSKFTNSPNGRNQELVTNIKGILNMSITSLFNRDLRTPWVWTQRVIMEATFLVDEYYDTQSSYAKKLTNFIPSNLLINAPLHNEKQLDVLFSYLVSLSLDINQLLKNSDTSFEYSDIFYVINGLTAIYGKASGKSVSLMTEKENSSWTEWSKCLDTATDKIKTLKTNVSNSEVIENLSELETKLDIINGCISGGSSNPLENPLAIFFKRIPSQSYKEGTIPPFIQAMIRQIDPLINKILHNNESFFDRLVFLKQIINICGDDLIKSELDITNPNKVEENLKIIYDGMDEIVAWSPEYRNSLKAMMDAFPKKITNIFELKNAQINLKRLLSYLRTEGVPVLKYINKVIDIVNENLETKEKHRKLTIFNQSEEFKYLVYINNTIDAWYSQIKFLEPSSKGKQQKIRHELNLNASIFKQENDEQEEIICEKINETMVEVVPIDRPDESPVEISPLRKLDTIDSLLNKKNPNQGIQDYVHYIKYNLGTIRELEQGEWPFKYMPLFSHAYLHSLSMILEHVLKLSFTNNDLNIAFQDRYGLEHTLQSTHYLDRLFDHFVKHVVEEKSFGPDEKKIQENLRSLGEIVVVDRNPNYQPYGKLCKTLKEIQEIRLLLESIEENNLSHYETEFCSSHLGKDSSKWASILSDRIKEKTQFIRNEGTKFLDLVLKLIETVLSEKDKQNTSANILLAPDLKGVFNTKKIKNQAQERAIKLLESIETLLSSEELQNWDVENSLSICFENSSLLKQILVNPPRSFEFTTAKLYYAYLGKLTEGILLCILSQKNPEYLELPYTSSSQPRPNKYSHDLTLFMEEVRKHFPLLVLSKAMKQELADATTLIKHTLHHPDKSKTASITQNLCILNDQSHMQLRLSQDNLNHNEFIKWFGDRYTKESSMWKEKIEHDTNFILRENVFSYGASLLEMLVGLLEQAKDD